MITSVVGFLTLTDNYWYTQFRDLTFTAATNQTSGAVVAVGNNVGVNFFNVGIQGNGGTWFNGIDFTGANAANSTSIDNCVIQALLIMELLLTVMVRVLRLSELISRDSGALQDKQRFPV